jgi:hypothetical protein
MQMTENLRNFIREHADDDVLTLMLEASRYEGVDVRFACGQIAARRRIKDKLPSWYANERLIIPSALAAEQCSSEQTALYKQQLVGCDDVVFDLTGGLGVDTYFLSRKARRVTYAERDEGYCEVARYNMKQLGADNVHVLNGDAAELCSASAGCGLSHGRHQTGTFPDAATVFYFDPARRGTGNRRLHALQDCEPDMTAIWPALRERRARIIVKLSPMLDISRILSQLPGVNEIHVVSVKNECKELLAVCCGSPPPEGASPHHSRAGGLPERENADGRPDVEIYCINFTSSGGQPFRFHYGDENTAPVSYAKDAGRYLYEPNSSVLKAGAYKTVSSRYGLEKLHANSHLYTSQTCLPSFAGRIFEVKAVYRFDNRLCRGLSALIPKANLSVRNFPLSVDELRRRIRVADGGDVYLFATTLSDGKKALIDCRRVDKPAENAANPSLPAERRVRTR